MEAEIVREDKVNRIADRIRAAATIEEALSIVAMGLLQMLSASGVATFLLDEQGEHLHGKAGSPDDIHDTIVKVRLSVDDESSAAVAAFRTRSAVVVDDAVADARAKKWLVAIYRAKSLMSIPIMTASQVLGAIVVLQHEPRRFTDEEVRLASHLASATANRLLSLFD